MQKNLKLKINLLNIQKKNFAEKKIFKIIKKNKLI